MKEETTKDTFGQHLKREREMRDVSLDEISAATRIATRFLRAIENEQWDQLPGGVFNRGFVRAVARYLGLDEENVVAEYTAAVGDRPGVPVWTGSPPAVTSDQSWLVWILAAVAVLALIAGGWFAVRRVSVWRASRRAALATAASATPPPAPVGVPSTSNTVNALNDAPNPSSDSTASPDVADSSASQPDATVSPDTAPLELKIEAGKATRVTVGADNHRVFQATMKAGDDHTFTAQNQFQISASDAGALVIELNGQTLAPIGATGRPGKVTLSRGALRGAPGGGN